MAWHVIYDGVTGELRGATAAAQQVPQVLWDVLNGVELDPEIPEPTNRLKVFAAKPEGFDWNPATLDYDIPVPPRVLPITSVEFMRRFTMPERIAIRAARAADPVLEDFFDLLVVASSITITDEDVQAGVGYLVAQGLISAERAAEILATE